MAPKDGVKWCLHLKIISLAAYHTMRTSGFLKLPYYDRTLWDYAHLVKAGTGIQNEVNALVIKEFKVNTLQELKKYIADVFELKRIW